ncbi:hypothetical protein [Burkholderia oklahomensis]|nr:hypothetical protein [Burkholderia oklahomensis]AOI48785.1 hypothetical protein WI23_23460 [Burkholderia oklahomensis C6786]MBI0363023.1 hypothetical protein [Burkholderia oklahomensis]
MLTTRAYASWAPRAARKFHTGAPGAVDVARAIDGDILEAIAAAMRNRARDIALRISPAHVERPLRRENRSSRMRYFPVQSDAP